MENTQSMVKNAKQTMNGMSHTAATAAEDLGDKAKAGANQIAKKADDLQGEWTDKLADKYDDIREQATQSFDSGIELVKKYPVYSILGAVAVGFFASALFRRSR